MNQAERKAVMSAVFTVPSALKSAGRHRELMLWALGRVGLEAGAFHVHRVRMRFPPTPICAAMDYGLRGEGGGEEGENQ